MTKDTTIIYLKYVTPGYMHKGFFIHHPVLMDGDGRYYETTGWNVTLCSFCLVYRVKTLPEAIEFIDKIVDLYSWDSLNQNEIIGLTAIPENVKEKVVEIRNQTRRR